MSLEAFVSNYVIRNFALRWLVKSKTLFEVAKGIV